MANSALTDYTSAYHAKLTDADTAMESVTTGSSVAIGQAASQPPELLRALAARAGRGEIDRVKLFYFHAEAPMADTVLRYELMGRFLPYSMFLQRPERDLIKRGDQEGRKVVNFIPTSFSASVRLFAESIPVDTCIVTVSPMDGHGYFTFGTNNDYTSSVARQATRLIVEVNPNMPRVYGESTLHVCEVDAIVENDAALPELPQRPISDLDRVIGKQVATLVDDRACVQIGVGGLPQAVCEELRDRADLGIHSEAFTPALADLVRRGVVTGRYKTLNRGKAVFTFAMGDRDTYQFMNDNIALESLSGQLRQRSRGDRPKRQHDFGQLHHGNGPHRRVQLRTRQRTRIQRRRRATGLRARRLRLPRRQIGDRLRIHHPRRHHQQDRSPALGTSHHAPQRNQLRRNRIRPSQPQGAFQHRTCRRTHRAGTPRLPGLAHRQRPTHAPHLKRKEPHGNCCTACG